MHTGKSYICIYLHKIVIIFRIFQNIFTNEQGYFNYKLKYNIVKDIFSGNNKKQYKTQLNSNDIINIIQKTLSH